METPIKQEPRRTCSECGIEISAANAKRLTCSDKCRRARSRRLAKERKGVKLGDLIKSLPGGALLSGTVSLRAVANMPGGESLADRRLTGLTRAEACEAVKAVGFEGRSARLHGDTVEALNSVSGEYTGLFTVARNK